MVNKQIYDVFYNTNNAIHSWYGKTEVVDCEVAEMIDTATKNQLRNNYGIPLDEEILFHRDTSFWNSKNQGLVITDVSIYCLPDNDDNSSLFYIDWEDISSVEYQELNLYFIGNQGQRLATIADDFFFKNNDAAESDRCCPTLAKDLTYIASLVEYVDPIELANNGNYNEAISLADDMISSNGENAYAYYVKGSTLLKYAKASTDENNLDKEVLHSALENLNLALKKCTDEGLCSEICLCRAFIYHELGDNWNARTNYIIALKNCSESMKKPIEDCIEETETNMSNLWENYTTLDYKDRKFLMPIKDYEIAGCVSSSIDTFRLSNVPSCVKFQVGHPVANELYIGHPYNPSVYVPFEKSEELFFVDRIHELCYLLQCLGAEEIKITSVKGKKIQEMYDSERNITGEADIKLFSGSSEYSGIRSGQADVSTSTDRSLCLRFDPIREPYVPDNLIWFNSQTEWQRLVDKRINGNMLEYNEYVSTSKTQFVTSSEKDDIKASAEYLWSNVNVNSEQKLKTEFRESTETQWKVEVKFRSIKLFADDVTSATSSKQQTTGYSATEQEYLENLKEFLEDDEEITPRERKMLNRIRQSLGISEERAQELEASLAKPQLTEDEQEYLDIYHEYAEKGEVTEKERRRLDKFAAAMGISAERAKEIEKV